MLLAGETNIREVIAFPMNQQAQDLMMQAPARCRRRASRSCTSGSSCPPSPRSLGGAGPERADRRDRLASESHGALSEATTVSRRITLAPDVDLLPLLGRNDDHLRTLEGALDVRIVAEDTRSCSRVKSGKCARPSGP